MRHAIALTAAVASLGALASTAGADTVKDCSIQPTGTVEITSARNMTCHRAAVVMADHQGSISKHFETTKHGFTCDRVSGGRLAGVWRCAKDGKAFRFDFAD